VARRPGRTTLVLALTILVFVLFGMARVAAPVSALGLVFDQPVVFAAVAAVVSIAGAVLLFVRPVELAVGGVMAGPAVEPSEAEGDRVARLLRRVGERAGIDTTGLIVRVQADPGVNASAGAAHLVFVTKGALALPDDELQAVLAHELGHHRGLHPVLTAVVWWLRLPGAFLAGVYRVLRRVVGALGMRFGTIGRLLALPLVLLLVVWQVTVMWVFYVGELLAMRAARVSEFEADDAAARWGYGPELAATYADLAAHELEDPGRLAGLMADHPPLSERIVRLERAATPAVGAHP
jgi:Zn-dependent protease with chaperone function